MKHFPLLRKLLRKCAVSALAGLMGLSLVLCSCEQAPATTDETTASPAATEGVTSPADGIAYTVTVQNPHGPPAKDIIIKIQKDGEDVALKLIGATGSAVFTLTEDDYTVRLESPSGGALHYDTEAARLSAAATELTLTVYEATGAYQDLSAPSQSGDYTRQQAATVGEGPTFVSFVSGEYTYVVFTPSRPGMYEFSCEEEGATLTYHGAPINVFEQPLMETVDGKVSFAIVAGSVGTTPDTTAQFVFRLEGPGNGCTFVVTRTGDVPKTPNDEPWTVLTAPADALKPYEGITDGRLTDLDVTDPTLTVVLGDDGYYHLDTTDGPVVFIRLSSANPYMADFKTITDTARICAYLYHEDGTFDRRESYNEVILEYLTVANEDGVVPLNEQLAYVVKTAGDFMGWWNFSEDLDIFGDKLVAPAIAWLFACAVYQ